MSKLLILLLLSLVASIFSTPLDDYVNAPDDTYKWTLNNTIEYETFTGYILELTSQTWMAEKSDWPVWKHWVSICVPKGVTTTTTFIYVDGGSNDNWKVPGSMDQTIEIVCLSSGSVSVGLTQIPNQPIIFNNDGVQRFEDDLVAYTWRQFLGNTSEPLWLARLPMTKAVVKCMDAVQEFGKTIGYNSENFVIAGASKRGWTTWLAGVVDPRIIAIVPIVMPILNMIPNMGHQFYAYGEWSFALNDYTGQGVMDYLNGPQMVELAAIVDPFSYRDRYTMPIYAIASSDDEFFLPDSPQFFWNNLTATPEKHLRIVPNAEHSLMGHQIDIILSIVTFVRLLITNQPRPTFTWDITYSEDLNSGTIVLTVPEGGIIPYKVKVWTAVTESTTRRDFRIITCMDITKCIQFIIWDPSDITPTSTGVYSITLSKPDAGWRAFFLEAEYLYAKNSIDDEYTLKFTSEVAIVPNTLPFGSCSEYNACGDGSQGDSASSTATL
ncbi:PhoPQ-activated pathogenicity-related protein [Dictyostelium discoideum AX4]|uniref:Autocrine proliferation repressor protein A n=1 Tax=Dictyostelium discoideum TaxID=44689 RepID=APRA_DICDI|nr:PhoPQ-activated pathogenicity-related protein [Dictyostelium discoideum AX4]Q5XM24.1 RecName: Full=Autocrine proliferation repressor protein A; AltName: Full=PhoPQ-activated pathogenicity-related protein; Flags: Precursor [Dictyostelium discoideum]AAU95081.1 AprA [Dictyostelium discoideum]EAL66593.1 PhoPQ-activated pathogenicity-related protein [Dictyostelium discoideum AX4]|eukprot:XP_640566.1 PhoPQ-activated pathogenicity-related protein [Dictyostelium discoideum AX4]